MFRLAFSVSATYSTANTDAARAQNPNVTELVRMKDSGGVCAIGQVSGWSWYWDGASHGVHTMTEVLNNFADDDEIVPAGAVSPSCTLKLRGPSPRSGRRRMSIQMKADGNGPLEIYVWSAGTVLPTLSPTIAPAAPKDDGGSASAVLLGMAGFIGVLILVAVGVVCYKSPKRKDAGDNSIDMSESLSVETKQHTSPSFPSPSVLDSTPATTGGQNTKIRAGTAATASTELVEVKPKQTPTTPAPDVKARGTSTNSGVNTPPGDPNAEIKIDSPRRQMDL